MMNQGGHTDTVASLDPNSLQVNFQLVSNSHYICILLCVFLDVCLLILSLDF